MPSHDTDRRESEHPAWPPVPWTDTTEIIGEVR